MISALLESKPVSFIAKVILTFPFWWSGVTKLANWNGALGEMAHFNLQPAMPFAIATIITQLGGTALILFGRLYWLGAGALGVFTALTIFIAHNFWTMAEPQRTAEYHVVTEHIGMIGALIVVAILRHREVKAGR